MKIRNYSVAKNLETYGNFYIDYEGRESSRPLPMTFAQAKYLAKYWGGYILPYDAWVGKGGELQLASYKKTA